MWQKIVQIINQVGKLCNLNGWTLSVFGPCWSGGAVSLKYTKHSMTQHNLCVFGVQHVLYVHIVLTHAHIQIFALIHRPNISFVLFAAPFSIHRDRDSHHHRQAFHSEKRERNKKKMWENMTRQKNINKTNFGHNSTTKYIALKFKQPIKVVLFICLLACLFI